MSLRTQACCDYEADIRLITRSKTFGKINGRAVRQWDGNTLKNRVKFVNNSSKYAFYLVSIAIISTVAAVISIPFSFPISFSFGCVAVLCVVGVNLLKKIDTYITKELKKQYVLNAQAYLHGGPVEAFKRKCDLKLFKGSEDFEMMDYHNDLEVSLAVEKAFEAAGHNCDGIFKEEFIRSLKMQQARFEKMRDENPVQLENLVINWFQGKRANNDLKHYCELQGRLWRVPQITIQKSK